MGRRGFFDKTLGAVGALFAGTVVVAEPVIVAPPAMSHEDITEAILRAIRANEKGLASRIREVSRW